MTDLLKQAILKEVIKFLQRKLAMMSKHGKES